MTIVGTCYFVSLNKAILYYTRQRDAGNVQTKLNENQIHIGPPALKPGERLLIIDGGTRYAIETPNQAIVRKIKANA